MCHSCSLSWSTAKAFVLSSKTFSLTVVGVPLREDGRFEEDDVLHPGDRRDPYATSGVVARRDATDDDVVDGDGRVVTPHADPRREPAAGGEGGAGAGGEGGDVGHARVQVAGQVTATRVTEPDTHGIQTTFQYRTEMPGTRSPLLILTLPVRPFCSSQSDDSSGLCRTIFNGRWSS